MALIDAGDCVGDFHSGWARNYTWTMSEISGTIATSVAAHFRLKTWFSPRPWGKPNLKPWYEETGTTELVGEAWLTGPQCVVESGPFKGERLRSVAEKKGGECPLLVKMLFPADKLSVQVHPDDAQAKVMGETRGKTECWYVLEAE